MNAGNVLMAASVASMVDQFNMHNIRLLQDMGYRVHVVCNFRKGNTCDTARIQAFCRELDRLGVQRHQWDCPRNVCRIMEDVKALKQLWRLTGEFRFEFVHCHSPVGGALARIVAHFRKIPVIYTAHGFHFYKGAPLKNWLLYYPAEKLLAYWTDVLVTVNREDYAFAKQNLPAKRIRRIPGVGIDTAAFAGSEADWEAAERTVSAWEAAEREKVGRRATDIKEGAVYGKSYDKKRLEMRRKFREKYLIPQDAVLLLSVGELNRGKNHRYVMDVLAEFYRDINSARKICGRDSHAPELYYMICGQGKLYRRLLKHARRLGMENRLRMPGYVEDVKAACQAADIFVFPSVREGMPVALMEAMASGLPCVASDIRGNRELVGADMRFGLDEPEKLKMLLRQFIKNPGLCRKCGLENQRRIQIYDTVFVQAAMESIYRRDITKML